MKNGEILNEIIQLLRVRKLKIVRQPRRRPVDYDKFWFHTPEACPNLEILLPLQEGKCNKMSEIHQRDSLDGQTSEEDIESFNSLIGPNHH